MRLWFFAAVGFVSGLAAQGKPELTVEKIMQDPDTWIGSLPDQIQWSEDGRWIYFTWNPDHSPGDSLYRVPRQGGKPEKVPSIERLNLPGEGEFNAARTQKIYEANGDLYLLSLPAGTIRRLTQTLDIESDPRFMSDNQNITYIRDRNLYSMNLQTGMIRQWTDFQKGEAPRDPTINDQEKWLRKEERRLIGILRERQDKEELAKAARRAEKTGPHTIYIGKKSVDAIRLSLDQRYITFRLTTSLDNRSTQVQHFIRDDGYAETKSARPKVGLRSATYEMKIYDLVRDTVYDVQTTSLSGITDVPPYRTDTTRVPRDLFFFPTMWSSAGHAVVECRALDNKDRWICALDPATGKLRQLDRQHDEAWIGGPGIEPWVTVEGAIGWMPDGQSIWFQSEETGYSHLMTLNVKTGVKKALTSGPFEVHGVTMSSDRKFFYLTTNEVHPGERQFYRMSIDGGKRERVTQLPGNHEVVVSPDDKTLAIRYSYSNKPWQLYIMENKPGAKMVQVTDDLSEDFKSYPWRDPELVKFKARDGKDVYARLYRPDDRIKNGSAVIFVHGAGYLQNVHRWWSSYFREYMFHNLLADRGITVLDIDYRGSEGYGRDWRTGIYRHMGGKDLSDHVDGARWLVDSLGIDSKRIGIYGGSYGGFITLMALFTEPDVFACGAALRSVTDWAHYNHPYTVNILNEPHLDTTAYLKSSPIYFAEGLKKPLLICHGMVDDNVQFQDVVRLAQRLIELGKDNWELAVYPMEPHAFKEASSWTDEYKRVLKLFKTYLK